MKLVIIGYGGMGGYHAGCLKSYSESAPEAPVEVVGVYDIAPERAAAGKKAGYKAYTSPEEIWADKAVDAVLIATPNDVHAAYVEAAAKAGKHIICEKPIGMSVKEAEEMYDAAEKAGVVFEVHQNRRWDDDYLTVQILRNERHCGDVLTRKTYTPDFHTHKAKKNYGKKPQSLYKNHHEAIVSRDDFIAVQHMLDNAKYGNKSFLPELKVISSGILKGFVIINPRWAAFKEIDYLQAAQSIYEQLAETDTEQPTLVDDNPKEVQIEVAAGDFDLRDFEITRSEFFDSVKQPYVVFANKKIKFGATITKKFADKNYIELLVNPKERKFAIRQTDKTNRQSVCCSKLSIGQHLPREIPASAFFNTLYDLFGWNTDYKYRIIGSLLEKDNEIAYVFNIDNSEAFFKPYILPKEQDENAKIQHLTPSGKCIRAIPQEWTNSFGKQYYIHEQSIAALAEQSEKDWKLRIDGQLCDTGNNLNVTGFDELRTYINQEISSITTQE